MGQANPDETFFQWEVLSSLPPVGKQRDDLGVAGPIAGIHGGALIVRAEYSAGVFKYTNILVIFDPFPNYIVIMDGPGGIGGGANIVGDKTYSVGETDTFYAAGYNYTAGYIGDIEVDWDTTDSSVGDIDVTTGIWTNFTAQAVSIDSTCRITADDSGLANNITGVLTVLASVSTVDYILIMDAANNAGSEVGDMTYGVNDVDFFYAAAFNTTTGYIGDVDATWSSSDDTVGDVAVAPPATFTAQEVTTDSTCVVTATYNGMTDDTGTLTVLAPTVDYIMIVTGPDETGVEVDTATYGAFDTAEFYAAAYNTTSGYIGEVEATWTSSVPAVGTVTTPGEYTTFEAQEVSSDSTCIVTANYNGMTDDTGLLTVLEPTLDEIRIRTAADEGGTVLDTPITLNVDDERTYYAAGYNATVGYLEDVLASWDVSTLVGSVFPSIASTSTTFTAEFVGTGRIEVSRSGVSNESAVITVQLGADVTPPPQPQSPVLDQKDQEIAIGIVPDIFTPDIDKYVIQRSTSSDGPWENITEEDADQLVIIYTDKDLDPDTKYYYRVIAVDEAGNPSPPSATVSATTDPKDEMPWLLLLLLIIIIIVILLLVLIMAKKKKKPEEELPPGAAAAPVETPMEEVPAEEEFVEEGAYEEEYTPEQTYEEEPQYDEAPPEEGEYEEEPQVEEEEPETSGTPPPPPPPPPPA
jgi:hypothetical protein